MICLVCTTQFSQKIVLELHVSVSAILFLGYINNIQFVASFEKLVLFLDDPATLNTGATGHTHTTQNFEEVQCLLLLLIHI